MSGPHNAFQSAARDARRTLARSAVERHFMPGASGLLLHHLEHTRQARRLDAVAAAHGISGPARDRQVKLFLQHEQARGHMSGHFGRNVSLATAGLMTGVSRLKPSKGPIGGAGGVGKKHRDSHGRFA